MSTLRQDTYRLAGVVLFVVAAVLLTSIGGLGIAAAPVTLPLLFLAVRAHPTRPFRVAGSVIGGLTAAELSWGMLYLVAGEMPVVSWLVPVAAALATGFAFVTVPGRRAGDERDARRG